MKVAFVYDRINKWGGAERVLLALHEIWPEAPFFTSVYKSSTASWADNLQVNSSFLQKFPFAKSKHEIFPSLMPIVFESFNFNDFDVVISITSEAGKGIITSPKILHLCYCLTPTRYLWSGYDEYFNTAFSRLFSFVPISFLKRWDKIAGQRPDQLIAISKTVQSRIKNYYHRESEVIYPPVETDKFKQLAISNKQLGKYYLIVSRLVKYKKIDLAIRAFNQLGWKLKIIGNGNEEKKLKKKAKNNIEFLGKLTDEDLLFYYQNCQALIFPQEEDFGITAVEAMACGKPVIAYSKGGAMETVISGKTGEFFYPQTAEALVLKLQDFKAIRFKQQDCRNQAEKFSEERFKIEFRKYIEEKWKNHIKTTCMP